MKSFEDTDPRPYDRHRYRVQFRDGSFKDTDKLCRSHRSLVLQPHQASGD